MKRFSIQQLVLIISLLLMSKVYGQILSEKQLLEKTLYVTKNVALKNPNDVYRLRLYDYTNADYAILQKFPNLMVLGFWENSRVEVIPPGFKKLVNLTYLDISETQIKMVSAFTKKNKNLKVVYAKSGQLDNLEKNALSKRGIKVIDNVSEYPLVFLKLEEKKETNVPVEETIVTVNTNYEKYAKNPLAAQLLSEKELKTKKVYTSLTEALKEPENVYRINIKKREEGMDISNLSTRIAELYNLQELELFGIYKSLPKEIGKLTQLQKVELSLPYLEKDLPLEIANWVNIKTLDIRMSSETETNKVIEFNSVCMLTTLEELEFEGANFHKVPNNIGNLNQLKKLNILISPIKSLPSSIGQLPNLTHLNLSSLKNLTSIPPISSSVIKAEFRNLDALVSLDQTFSKAINLDYLTLNSLSSLQNFNQSMKNLEKLRVLWLADIPLVTKLFNLDELDYLERIYISNLKSLNYIGSEFDNADALEEIDIKDCPNLTINSNFESLVLLRRIKLENIKTPKLDLKGFEISEPNNKYPNLYSYFRAINLENAFNKNENIYYNFIKKYKQMADLTFVLKTKNKSLVSGVALHSNYSKQEIDLFLSTIDSYSKLDSLSVSFGPIFSFTPVSIDKKLSKLNFEAQMESEKVTNWQKANDFINCFLNVNEFNFSGLSKTFYEGNFTSMTNVKKIRIDGLGQVGIISDMSKMLQNCKNLEHFELREASNYVPFELFNLNTLKTIDVSVWEPKTNLYITIPDNILNLTKLEKLRIFINDQPTPIKHNISQNINKLQNLQVLYLTFGGLNKNTQKITFPNGIENLKKLQSLTLVPCNGSPIGLDKLKLTSEFKCNY